MKKTIIHLLIVMSFLMTIAQASPLKKFSLNEKLDQAYVRIDGDQLIAGTGEVERCWKWGGNGLLTTSLKNLTSQQEWVTTPAKLDCDWSYKGFMPKNSAKLVSVTARKSLDGGFALKHIELVAEIHYPQVAVKYIVWIFPGTSGLRTQLKIKKLGQWKATKKAQYDITPKSKEYDLTAASKILTGRTESLPISTVNLQKKAMGYYNHTQGRNKSKTPLLHEENVNDGIVDWASALSLESKQGGVILVKESHKCVSQAGVNTGVFEIKEDSVSSTGWGILPADLTANYQGYWANWLILHSAPAASGRELALKEFDRIRYPIDPKRDIYIMANTWGTGESKNWSQSAAREENVLVEIDSQSDLGIDVQQVDDGWQGWMTAGPHWRPVSVLDFGTMKKKKGAGDGEVYNKNTKKYDMYPEGWKNIRSYAKKEDVKLGLWCHARVPLKDLKWNFDQGGFKSYKIDFVNAKNFNNLKRLMNKVRSFIKYTKHQVRMNWDVTEHPPRIGYFFAREYGNIYLENRKTKSPKSVVYIPHLVLRDAWQLSKYTNLNKFQISVQNGDRCNKSVSDAHLHSHDYLVAQTLMGSPIFFQETHYYSNEARQQIKPLLRAYRQVRDEMYKGYVFPIGDKPDNKSWSGFQNYNPQTKTGFITVFRQLKNNESSKSIKLRFLKDKQLVLTNLMTGVQKSVQVTKDGELSFHIDKAADYRFLKYEVK
ncbi:MAG: hypothetical protein HRT88_05990 [Lentisphaeraceae bacterium]|nr:hypothetical protein [Lentisphaeraceae bacterium]